MPLKLKDLLPEPETVTFEKDGKEITLFIDPNISDDTVKMIDNFRASSVKDANAVEWQEIINLLKAVFSDSKKNSKEDIDFFIEKSGALEKSHVVLFASNYIQGTIKNDVNAEKKN